MGEIPTTCNIKYITCMPITLTFKWKKVNNEPTKKFRRGYKNGQTVAKIRESESCVKKFKPIKVATPGTFVGQISDSSKDEAT